MDPYSLYITKPLNLDEVADTLLMATNTDEQERNEHHTLTHTTDVYYFITTYCMENGLEEWISLIYSR